MKARVLIRPKEGILDPQGKAVEREIPALCEKLLANPLIEDFEIETIE
jgi:phosphoribosylformylglycinamidine synthase subunit PurS